MSPPPLLVSAVSVSSKSQKHPNLESGELRVGGERYRLLADRDGSLKQSFPHQVKILPSQKVQLKVTYVTKICLLSKSKTIDIKTQPLFASAQSGQPQAQVSVAQREVELTLFGQEQVATPSLAASASTTTLQPTTDAMLNECGRFRVLVMGKSGVGKSTLINKAFGINKAHASDLWRGEANIDLEITSPANRRFVLHDSFGFEPGDDDKLAIVERFVARRQNGPPQERLHAIWYATQTPFAGERLLEASTEHFCSKSEILGDVPLIVVFTKYDHLFDELLIKKVRENPGVDDNTLNTLAREEANQIIQTHVSRINGFAGKTLSTAVISSEPGYEDTVANLVNLTESLVSESTWIVVSMAQRVDPTLKIDGCLFVGKQKYWKALRTSPDFAGHTIWDCLKIIHKDIIAVWNVYDPKCYLNCDEFMKLVVESVRDVQVREVLKPSGMITLSGSTLVAAVSAFISGLANPAAPIILPILVGLAAATWLYLTYRHVPNVQQYFIAYIVDLTHIMETLFVLSAGRHEQLTRRAINFALQFYFQSALRSHAHQRIGEYRDIQGRDAALDLIESLIIPEKSADLLPDYYAQIGKMDLRKLKLDDDMEDWVTTVRKPVNEATTS